jgi:hypothetical protein
MVTVETVGKVRHAFLVKDKGIKRIACELHLARNTVRGIIRGEETERRYVRSDQPLPQLGGFSAARRDPARFAASPQSTLPTALRQG